MTNESSGFNLDEIKVGILFEGLEKEISKKASYLKKVVAQRKSGEFYEFNDPNVMVSEIYEIINQIEKCTDELKTLNQKLMKKGGV